MADAESTIKYLKVTDTSSKSGATVGYHSVDTADIIDANGNAKPFELPRLMGDGQSFEWVDEAEARREHPALFGISPEDAAKAKPAKIEKAE